jgi:glutathione S-transferase
LPPTCTPPPAGRVLRPEERRSAVWTSRCEGQIHDTLALLESERRARTTPWWLGEGLSHADVAVGCTLRFIGEAHPRLFAPDGWPALWAHAARCEALPEFQEIVQPLTVKLD